MRVTSVKLRGFRVIEAVDLLPSPGVNVIAGRNGAGKTSVIEAVYVAGRGQSFRHREVRPWIREGSKSALILVETVGQQGQVHRLGIEQGRNGRRVRLDGKDLERRSQQAQVLPLQLLTQASHELIEKGPAVRRRFLDWGLFHVEPSFHGYAIQYRKLLAQRNAALRDQEPSFIAWDPQLGQFGDAIETLRTALIPAIQAYAQVELSALGLGYGVELNLRSSWDRGVGLESALRANRHTDKGVRHTSVGPHRSVLEVAIDGAAAERRLSRGQQKLLVYALVFGIVRLVGERSRESVVLLIDDLPAELDRVNRVATMQRVVDLGVQAFVTGVEFDDELLALPLKVFHVEQGQLICPE